MIFAIEVWTVAESDAEEPSETKMVDEQEFEHPDHASRFAWDRMEEGYFTRLWRR